MSKSIPSALAIDLSSVADGNTADATPVASALVAVENALNQLSAALSSGTSGQFLQAVDGTDVVWGSAADKASSGVQTFTGPVSAKQLGFAAAATASVATGTLTIVSGYTRITATDGTSVANIPGNTAAGGIIVIRNLSGSAIPFVTGGSPPLLAAFSLPNQHDALLVWDTLGASWNCIAITDGAGRIQSASPAEGIGYATGAGGTVTQLTSQTTGVTVNKICGTINTFSAAVNAGAEFSFVVTNSTVAVGDVVAVSGMFPGCLVSTLAANGSFTVTVHNASGSNNTGSFAINFAVIKAVSA